MVNVVYEIFKQLLKYYPDDFKDLDVISLFSGIGAFEKALEKLEMATKFLFYLVWVLNLNWYSDNRVGV